MIGNLIPGRGPEHSRGSRVGKGDDAVRVKPDDAVADRAQDQPAPLFRCGHPLFRSGEKFEEPDEKGLMRVACVILVESGSQKGIVIGREGAMAKRIGTEARVELERFFNCRLFLELHVKVRADWRDDERILDELGLGRRRE